jgi:thiol-disulfide isomerase/thioredoxin
MSQPGFSTPRQPVLWMLLALCMGVGTIFADEAPKPSESRCMVAQPQSIVPDDFQAVDLSGRRWTKKALEGRHVLIVFWATWCTRCVDELTALKEIRSEYGDQVEVIGVNLDGRDRPPVAAFLKRHRIDWPQIHEGRGMNSRLARLFGVPHLPFSVLLGPEGQIISSATSICGLRPLLESASLTADAFGSP